jgi:hypothetical protein
VVGPLGVASGDVPRRTLVEAKMPEQPEGCGEPLLAVPALLFRAAEVRKHVRCTIGRHHLGAYRFCTAQSNKIG